MKPTSLKGNILCGKSGLKTPHFTEVVGITSCLGIGSDWRKIKAEVFHKNS